MHYFSQIEQAKKQNKPIDTFVKKQINLLEESYDEFVSAAHARYKDVELNSEYAGTRIKQLQILIHLCKKIGLSTEKYEKEIRDIRVRKFGEEFADEYWKNK